LVWLARRIYFNACNKENKGSVLLLGNGGPSNCPGQFSAPIKLFFASGAALVSSEASVPGQQEELCALCGIEG
jgi:hypothetical protein